MVLLDTCTLLWLAADQSRLSSRARDLIADHADALFLSSISAFEIASKHRKGALVLPLAPVVWFKRALQHHGINEIPVSGELCTRSVDLPQLHNDPCDRIIIATAQAEGLSILTPDPMIRAYPGVQVYW